MKSPMKLLLIISISLSSVFSFAKNDKRIDGQVFIFDLLPTQAIYGNLEVERKVKKMSEMDAEEQEEYLRKKVVPIVKWKGLRYMIDHHHHSIAAHRVGFQAVYYFVQEDLSHLNENDFWDYMKKKNYVFLKNEQGHDITPDQLPKALDGLKDDKYRSLSGALREEGGFEKSGPHAENKWANFLRPHLNFENSKKGLKKIMPEALKLARSEAAKDLPGYIGKSCKRAFGN